MKRKRVNPHTQLILRHYTQVFRECYHACCVDAFVEDEIACKVDRAVRVSNIRLTELVVSRLSGMFETEGGPEIT